MNDKFKKIKSFVSDKFFSSELFSETVFEAVPMRCVYISGCRKIKGYEKDLIELECKGTNAAIYGENMKIEDLVNGQIAVVGKIRRLEFD